IQKSYSMEKPHINNLGGDYWMRSNYLQQYGSGAGSGFIYGYYLSPNHDASGREKGIAIGFCL
ncbi:MAG: hypothetical protein Q4A51_08580, partial [Lachnospiraceae bacterium]|nr:hypothetical protein [Lachnospiraceae bacterium]